MKECIKPFIFFYLQTFYDISLFLSLLFCLPSLSPPSLSLLTSFMKTSSQLCFHCSTHPYVHNPSATFLFFKSDQILCISVNFCKSSVSAQAQSCFRISILAKDVQTGAPKLPNKTGRLISYSLPTKLLSEFK
jgi:hypothetical protein